MTDAATESYAMKALAPGEVLFLVSVDTEEDNWVPARDGITVENARQLPPLHRLFERLGIRPTYFVTDTLAVDPMARAIVRDLGHAPDTEIGAHLHPWNTPPLDEPFIPRNTMLHNLPAALQRAKLDRLTRSLEACLDGRRPISFRAGRWGIGSSTIGALLDCGYEIDSSVTPYTSWAETDDGPSHVGAPVRSYRLSRDSDVRRPSDGPLVEIPPSYGLTRGPLHQWYHVYRAIRSGAGRALMLDRVAARLGALRHATLSPEVSPVDDMLALTRVLLAEGVQHLHLYFHSPTLLPGLTPFVQNLAERDRFLAQIEEYVERAAKSFTMRFATVREAASILEPGVPAS